MSKVNWIKCADRLPSRSGIYLIAYTYEPDTHAMVSCGDFFKKGDIIMFRSPEHEEGETKEQYMCKVLFGEGLEEYAPKDDFYCRDDKKWWVLRPTYWAELPDAPEGFEWMKEEC